MLRNTSDPSPLLRVDWPAGLEPEEDALGSPAADAADLDTLLVVFSATENL